MTTDDRGKAALAEALLSIKDDDPGILNEIAIDDRAAHPIAAAILGDRAVFWPTGKDEYRELVRQREAEALAAERARIVAGSVSVDAERLLPAIEELLIVATHHAQACENRSGRHDCDLPDNILAVRAALDPPAD
jgi:hypothetical protein